MSEFRFHTTQYIPEYSNTFLDFPCLLYPTQMKITYSVTIRLFDDLSGITFSGRLVYSKKGRYYNSKVLLKLFLVTIDSDRNRGIFNSNCYPLFIRISQQTLKLSTIFYICSHFNRLTLKRKPLQQMCCTDVLGYFQLGYKKPSLNSKP